MEFTSRELRAFHVVAQHRSFARAAEKLFMTPSGVSVLIRELERQLGFRLFDRTTRHVELTAYGSELLAITQPSLKALDADEGLAIIPSFGLPACRDRKVTVSELVDPIVTLEFYEVSHSGRKLPEETRGFSAFLKRYIARWAGEAGILSKNSCSQR